VALAGAQASNFPIITLSEDAFCRLVASTLVAGLQHDVPDPDPRGN
jgi:hypothetical protein